VAVSRLNFVDGDVAMIALILGTGCDFCCLFLGVVLFCFNSGFVCWFVGLFLFWGCVVFCERFFFLLGCPSQLAHCGVGVCHTAYHLKTAGFQVLVAEPASLPTFA